MKQFFTGIGVLFILAVYSIGIRHKVPVIGKPAALTSGNNNASASTTSSGSNNAPAATPPPTSSANYKDGTYTGQVADAYYGNVQVSVTISGGKITGVKFLQYPNSHSVSVIINQQAMPYLRQETIKAQSANVQIISGATFTSEAFQQSLQSALSKA